MPTAKVTRKGHVTIPADLLRELGIEPGDDLVFEVTSERSFQVRVVKRRRLSDFYGALPATRPFPGKEEVRQVVGRAMGKALRNEDV